MAEMATYVLFTVDTHTHTNDDTDNDLIFYSKDIVIVIIVVVDGEWGPVILMDKVCIDCFYFTVLHFCYY